MSTQFSKRECRPREHLSAAGKHYPLAWKQIDEFRAGRGKDLPAWPEWCFAPLAAWYSIVCAETQRQALDARLVGDVGRLAAFGAWRVTQGIYRFDPGLYEAIIATPVDGALPCDVLYRLPEWSVYVETPGMLWAGSDLYGFFVHLEWDANTERHELRLLLDSKDNLLPIPLHLGNWSLAEAVERMLKESRVQGMLRGVPKDDMPTIELAPTLQPLISLVLYLCSANAEIGDGTRAPTPPIPKRTKDRWRLFAADKPTTWDVGLRIGAALRQAYCAGEATGEGVHSPPKPHIRRAHWHGFWSGPKNTPDERKMQLKWLPPIAVNVTTVATIVSTARAVQS